MEKCETATGAREKWKVTKQRAKGGIHDFEFVALTLKRAMSSPGAQRRGRAWDQDLFRFPS